MINRLLFLLLSTVASAQDGLTRVTLVVMDLQGRPIAGVSLASTLAPTGDDGRTVLVVNRQLRPGEEIDLAIVGTSPWVFLTPDYRIQYPDDPRETVAVHLVRRGDRDILASPLAKQAILENLLTLIEAHFDVSSRIIDEERNKEALAQLAENLGLPAETIDQSLRLWQDQTQDPYQLGLAALYEQRFLEAIHYLEESYFKALRRVDFERKDLAKNAFYLGQAMDGEGKYRQALLKFREAAALDPGRETTYQLSTALYKMGHFEVAESLFRQSLAIVEASYDPNHSEVALHLNNLAQLLAETNRSLLAESLMRRALAISKASFGAEHPCITSLLNNLAKILQTTNRLSEAEFLFRTALSIDEVAHGSDHPDVARDLSNLASLLQETNRLQEAELLIRRALSIDETYFGREHPRTAIQLNNMAQLLHQLNRLSEAGPLMRRALAIDEAAYGSDHPSVAIRLNNLAGLLQETSQLSEAELLMRQALAIDETSYGSGHPSVARDLNNLATLLLTVNRLSEAEPLMRRVLTIDERSFAANIPKWPKI